VRLLAMRPDSTLRSAVSTFREDETGYPANWQPSAYALCTSPLVGMERVAGQSASSSEAKSVVATCPAGKRVVGVGGASAGGSGQVVLEVIRPDKQLKTVTVVSREDQNGFAGNWTVSAYAVCAKAPQGLERVVATRVGSDEFTDVQADCSPGRNLLAMGGEVSGQSGQLSLETYVLPGAAPPVADASAAGYARAWQDEDGYPRGWNVTAFAICANSATLVIEQSESDSTDFNNAAADCPAGKLVTGVGGDITGGLKQVHMTTIDLRADLGGAIAESYEDGGAFNGDWSQRVYAICATPLPGLEIVTGSTSSFAGVATATCPAGKKVVTASGGVLSQDDGRDVFMEDVAPQSNLTTVQVQGRALPGFTGAGLVTFADGLCATPPPGLQLVRAERPLDSDEIAQVTATCPAGKHLLGVGGEIESGGGQVRMNDLRPDAALKSVTVTGVEDVTGYEESWRPRAHAICANY
jgi:hypothetical protein